MRGRSALLIIGLAIAGVLVTSTPATAKPLEKGRFHDVFTEFFTCESTGTPVQHDVDVWVNFNLNQRGSSPFPYYRERARHRRVHQPGHRRHVHQRFLGEPQGPRDHRQR